MPVINLTRNFLVVFGPSYYQISTPLFERLVLEVLEDTLSSPEGVAAPRFIVNHNYQFWTLYQILSDPLLHASNL